MRVLHIGPVTTEKRRVKVLSLGAGVQSSALALAFERRERGFENPPDFAVFADTQAEPKEVYDFLKKLQSIITKFPIYVATAGDLGEAPHKIPFFIRHLDGKRGMGWRQCTNEYKIQVVNKEIRRVLGYIPRQRWKHTVETVLGISTDEIQRMKDAREKWKVHSFPLIDNKWSRRDCLDYLKQFDLTPPRSACIFCPYKTKGEWKHMRDHFPEEFEKACQYDESIRHTEVRMGGSTAKVEQFVSYDLLPLREVNLNTRADKKKEFALGMQNECEGMCGV